MANEAPRVLPPKGDLINDGQVGIVITEATPNERE